MNEYYGIASTPTDDFLAHYGIKGMKWGVRKFAKDRMASPSKKFNKLYSEKSSEKVGPRTIQRHYNSLDKSRANIARKIKQDKISALSSFYLAYKNRDKEKDRDYYVKEQAKANEKYKEHEKQFENVGKMQNLIAKKALNLGYDSVYTPTIRTSKNINSLVTGKVSGYKAKVRKSKNGKGSSTIALYNMKKNKWYV